MIKKLLSAFAISTLIAANGFAQQVANGGFESAWVAQSGYSDAPNWGSPNLLSSSPTLMGNNPVCATQAIAPDKNSGTYAIKITTFAYSKGFIDLTPYLPNDTLGFIFYGKIVPSPPYLIPGLPQTTRYAQLDFYAKYVPVGSDQGSCSVLLKKWTGTKVDTIAYGATLIASNASFVKLTVPLTYKSVNAPDTAVIVFNSSYKKPQVGSALWVDDVAFTGAVGINERNMLMNTIRVYPNPATDNITLAATMRDQNLSLVEIFDATGHKVDVISVQNNKTELSVNNYAAGLYMYNAFNNKQELIGIGKFNVTK